MCINILKRCTMLNNVTGNETCHVCPVCPSVRPSVRPFVCLVYCGQTVGWIKVKLGMEVGRGPGHIVRWGPSPPKGGTTPQFSVHIYCGQTAGWIKRPLSTEVGLGPGGVVLHGDPDSPKGGTVPNFRPMSILAKRLDGSRCHLVRM